MVAERKTRPPSEFDSPPSGGVSSPRGRPTRSQPRYGRGRRRSSRAYGASRESPGSTHARRAGQAPTGLSWSAGPGAARRCAAMYPAGARSSVSALRMVRLRFRRVDLTGSAVEPELDGLLGWVARQIIDRPYLTDCRRADATAKPARFRYRWIPEAHGPGLVRVTTWRLPGSLWNTAGQRRSVHGHVHRRDVEAVGRVWAFPDLGHRQPDVAHVVSFGPERPRMGSGLRREQQKREAVA